MRQVIVTIEGTLLLLEYCSQKVMANYDDPEDGFNSEYYLAYSWDMVDAIYVDGNEDLNLRLKKGKMVEVDDYFHNLFSETGDHPLPVELHLRQTHGGERIDYIIELEDDEEFDIKKVQLLYSVELASAKRSDNGYFSRFILAEKIMYNGKRIEVDSNSSLWDLGIGEKMHNSVIVESWIQ